MARYEVLHCVRSICVHNNSTDTTATTYISDAPWFIYFLLMLLLCNQLRMVRHSQCYNYYRSVNNLILILKFSWTVKNTKWPRATFRFTPSIALPAVRYWMRWREDRASWLKLIFCNANSQTLTYNMAINETHSSVVLKRVFENGIGCDQVTLISGIDDQR